jgi:hypothetical protein
MSRQNRGESSKSEAHVSFCFQSHSLMLNCAHSGSKGSFNPLVDGSIPSAPITLKQTATRSADSGVFKSTTAYRGGSVASGRNTQ